MGVDEIITLEDGKEYILLLESRQDDGKYFLAVEAVNDAPTDHYELLKEIVIDGELSVEEVVDEDAKQRLIEDLENQYDEMDVED